MMATGFVDSNIKPILYSHGQFRIFFSPAYQITSSDKFGTSLTENKLTLLCDTRGCDVTTTIEIGTWTRLPYAL